MRHSSILAENRCCAKKKYVDGVTSATDKLLAESNLLGSSLYAKRQASKLMQVKTLLININNMTRRQSLC